MSVVVEKPPDPANAIDVEASVWSPARLRDKRAVGMEDALMVWLAVVRLVTTFEETAAFTRETTLKTAVNTATDANKKKTTRSARDVVFILLVLEQCDNYV